MFLGFTCHLGQEITYVLPSDRMTQSLRVLRPFRGRLTRLNTAIRMHPIQLRIIFPFLLVMPSGQARISLHRRVLILRFKLSFLLLLMRLIHISFPSKPRHDLLLLLSLQHPLQLFICKDPPLDFFSLHFSNFDI